MNRQAPWVRGGLVGAGALALALAARADEVFRANLLPAATGGARAMVPLKIALSETKPETVTKEPPYVGKASYGVITLGDAKNNAHAVVVDVISERAAPRLYVDANGDGDLTNDPAVKFAPLPAPKLSAPPKPGARDKAAEREKGAPPPADVAQEGERYGATVNVTARYAAPGRLGAVESALSLVYWGGDLTYNREYARAGTLRLGENSYRVALVDQKANGLFDKFQHEEDAPPVVTLLVDRDGDGKFDPRTESFDAAGPFRLGGGTYEVSAIDVKGTSFVLKTSRRKASVGAARPDEMKKGGEPIYFDAALLDGKKVSFPEDYKGKVVLLTFWAMASPASAAEIANLQALYADYSEAGFDVLAVSVDRPNSRQELTQFVQANNIAWAVSYDGKPINETARLYEIRALPTSFLVDGDTGKILAMGKDAIGEALRPVVEKALAKKRK